MIDKTVSLLDLAVAITGRQVDMDYIQIHDVESFSQITQFMMQAAAQYGVYAFENEFSLNGWVQDDKRLIVKAELGKRYHIVEIAQAQWTELNDEKREEIAKDLSDRKRDNPDELRDLLDDMVSGVSKLKQNYDETKKNQDAMKEKIKQMIFICDKSTTALIELRKMVQGLPFVSEVDKWLISNAQYFIFSSGDRREKLWAAKIDNIETLLNKGLIEFIKNTPDGAESAALVIYWLKEFDRKRIEDKWMLLGGGGFL